jgi:hypothetical protein|tara:strand:+ start:903 stop:1397 length:495 start_codon:yes stop_codon:yes gene_type:complete
MLRIINIGWLLCISVIVNGQLIRFESTDLSGILNLKIENDSVISYVLEIKPIADQSIYLYHQDDVLYPYMSNYLGVGLFSHISPYLPNHMAKFKTVILNKVIGDKPTIIKGYCSYSNFDTFEFSMDYYLNPKRKSTKKIISTDIGSYSDCMRRVRLIFSLCSPR